MTNTLILKTSNQQNIDYSNYSIVIPSVSVGNVGQLSVDVLIATLKPEKIAVVHHPALLPVVGYDPYNDKSEELATACDLYKCESKKLFILQIRSLLIAYEKDSFIDAVCSWIKTSGFKEVIVLGSSNARYRHDAQMVGTQIRYYANASWPQTSVKTLIETGVKEMEESIDESGKKDVFIHGGGFLKKFIDKSSTPALALLKFVDEGDNTADALSLVEALNLWTKYQNGSWKVPFSWRNLFGPSPSASIY